MSGSPYIVLLPRSRGPYVLTCEHAGRRVPASLRPRRADLQLLGTHRGWDIGIWQVVREVSRLLRATAVGGRFSRLVVDLNRAPADSSLILPAVDGLPVSFNARLTLREHAMRLAHYHAPYHDEIDRQLVRRARGEVASRLLSFHSFTPTINPRRRRFDVGVLFADHASLARKLGRHLAAEGYSVRFNRPYSGLRGLIYSASRHGARHGVPYLELEFNQRLLVSPEACRSAARRAARAIEACFAGGAGPYRNT